MIIWLFSDLCHINLYMICLNFDLNTISHIYEFLYILDAVLHEFLETGTSDRIN